MQEKINLALIYGSARPGRMCDRVAEWAAAEVERHGGFTLDRLDPADPAVSAAIHGEDRAARKSLEDRVDAAEAFLVVVPEYNHSFPAPLKALIDAFKSEWQAKPVAFVSYGGISGGLRAVEHLRGVFAELHAVGIRDGVSFANVRSRFGEDGRLLDPEAAQQAAAHMLAHLTWWAQTLKDGRQARAYGEIAA
ncbi:MAG: NADPH-dependent FMN reductase [Dichotomicrobium sp.]